MLIKYFYVYIYFDTRKISCFNYGMYTFEMEPFYVGKGYSNRYSTHLKTAKKKNKYKHNKIRKIKEDTGSDPQILIFKNNLTEREAFKLEIKLIKIIGRHDLKTGPLTNATNGGDGATGLKHSEETKHKISVSSMGNKNCLGREISEETRIKISETKKNKHAHLSEEHKRKLSKSLTGRCFSEEHKRKLRKPHKMKCLHLSEEHKRKIGNANRKFY